MEYFDNEGEGDIHVMSLEDEDQVVEAASNFYRTEAHYFYRTRQD